MNTAHQQFWNNWAEAYQNFSELVEPYRDAQSDLARCAVAALQDGVKRTPLSILDVGGGAGNMVMPLLDALLARRGNLEGVNYTLMDNAERMLEIARSRLNGFVKKYPHVAFHFLDGDATDINSAEMLNLEPADLVMSSWAIEYYHPDQREQLLCRLAELANTQGIVAFSSMIHLPTDLTIRDVLMPLGRAHVMYTLFANGPIQMKKVVDNLKKMAKFAVAVRANYFPDKPTLSELCKLVRQAGLYSVTMGYHLYGTSAIVIVSEEGTKLPPIPKLPIAQALAGRDGYEEYSEIVTFWGYFKMLMNRHNKTKTRSRHTIRASILHHLIQHWSLTG